MSLEHHVIVLNGLLEAFIFEKTLSGLEASHMRSSRTPRFRTPHSHTKKSDVKIREYRLKVISSSSSLFHFLFPSSLI